MPDHLAVAFVEDANLAWGDEVVFLVNDIPLRDGVPSTAEVEWIGPPIRVLASHRDHLRGGPDRWEDPGADPWYDDPALLACSCGQPECRAVLVHIDVTEEVVRWTEFRSGHADEFTRLEVGLFAFDRSEYESVLRQIEERGGHP